MIWVWFEEWNILYLCFRILLLTFVNKKNRTICAAKIINLESKIFHKSVGECFFELFLIYIL